MLRPFVLGILLLAIAGVGRAEARPVGRLILVRHGESVANKGAYFAGRRDVALTDLGRQQAFSAGERFRGLRIDRVYTSRLSRASITARLFLRGAGIHGLRLRTRSALLERGLGMLRGVPKSAVVEQFGQDALDAWRLGYDTPIPDGTDEPGETLRQVHDRVRPFLLGQVMADLRAGRNVLVASHMDPIRAIIGTIEGMTPAELEKLEVPNGTPFVFRLGRDGRLVRESR